MHKDIRDRQDKEGITANFIRPALGEIKGGEALAGWIMVTRGERRVSFVLVYWLGFFVLLFYGTCLLIWLHNLVLK
jgi:hypothetical protein